MTPQMLEDRRIDFAVIIIGNIEALPDSKAGNQIVVGKTSTFRNQHSSNIHQTAKDRVSSRPFAAGYTVGGATLTLTGSRTITASLAGTINAPISGSILSSDIAATPNTHPQKGGGNFPLFQSAAVPESAGKSTPGPSLHERMGTTESTEPTEKQACGPSSLLFWGTRRNGGRCRRGFSKPARRRRPGSSRPGTPGGSPGGPAGI